MSDTKTDAISYIGKSSYALLITVGEENRPGVRYVGPFVNRGLDIYFMTSKDSQKVKHITMNPFVSLHFQNQDKALEGINSVTVSGKASRVPEGNEFNSVLEELGRKSPGFKKWVDKEGFNTWTIYKLTAGTLQHTDFSKSKKTIKEEV
jgi:uncharacterized protein